MNSCVIHGLVLCGTHRHPSPSFVSSSSVSPCSKFLFCFFPALRVVLMLALVQSFCSVFFASFSLFIDLDERLESRTTQWTSMRWTLQDTPQRHCSRLQTPSFPPAAALLHQEMARGASLLGLRPSRQTPSDIPQSPQHACRLHIPRPQGPRHMQTRLVLKRQECGKQGY